MRVDLESSFFRFIYPFAFDRADYGAVVRAVDAANWDTFRVWKPAVLPRGDMLPHVAELLNPEDSRLQPTAILRELDEGFLSSPRGLGGQAEWTLLLGTGHSIPFQITSAQLTVFCDGVGFLTLEAQPRSTDGAAWLDFLHHFRFTGGGRAAPLSARRRVGLDPVTQEPQYAPSFPGLVLAESGQMLLGELLNALLARSAPGAGEASDKTPPWWRDLFVPHQLIPFAGFWVRDASDPLEQARLLYHVRHFFHATQAPNVPPEELRLDHESLLPYAQGQWFVFSLEGGAFVACDSPATQFYQETLPGHLRSQYFLLLLLALHQRFALIRLSEDVAKSWIGGDQEQRLTVFRRIHEALLEFTARGYFAQVMQHANHHRCYQRWLEIFQVDRLYEEVKQEVRDMRDELQFQYQERLERLAESDKKYQERLERLAESDKKRQETLAFLISVLGPLLGVPALVIGFLGINISGLTGTDGWPAILVAAATFGAFAAGAALVRLMFSVVKRRDGS